MSLLNIKNDDLTNYNKNEIIQSQLDIITEQDKIVSELNDQVKCIKDIAIMINTELTEREPLLNKLTYNVDITSNRMSQLTSFTEYIRNKLKNQYCQCCCTTILSLLC